MSGCNSSETAKQLFVAETLIKYFKMYRRFLRLMRNGQAILQCSMIGLLMSLTMLQISVGYVSYTAYILFTLVILLAFYMSNVDAELQIDKNISKIEDCAIYLNTGHANAATADTLVIAMSNVKCKALLFKKALYLQYMACGNTNAAYPLKLTSLENLIKYCIRGKVDLPF